MPNSVGPRETEAVKLTRFLLVSLTLCVLYACGGASPSASSSGQAGTSQGAAPGNAPAKPCDVLVKGDVEAALGLTVNAPTEDLVLGSCTYGNSDFSSSASITITSWDALKTAANSGNRPATKVDGVGDDALTVGGGSIYVRKGTRGFLLLIVSPAADHAADHGLSIAKDLAIKCLAKF